MKRLVIAPLALMLVASFAGGCSSSTSNTSEEVQKDTTQLCDSANERVITLFCDKSFENVINRELEAFEIIKPKDSFRCQFVNQAEALDSFIVGNTRMVVIGRDLTNDEKEKLKMNNGTMNVRSMKIAVDAVALIVNPENSVSKLSMEEISNILSGRISNWSQIQPEAPDKKIRVIVDDPGSGLATYMRYLLTNGAPFDASAVVNAGSVKAIFDRVKTNPYAIGIVGVSWLTTDLTSYSDHNDPDELPMKADLKNDTVAIDGAEINRRMAESGVKTIRVMSNSLMAYAPTQENIYSGDYPLVQPIYMITTASPAGPLGQFYNFVTGKDGQRLIMKTGVMPARVNIQIYQE